MRSVRSVGFKIKFDVFYFFYFIKQNYAIDVFDIDRIDMTRTGIMHTPAVSVQRFARHE